ncbi:MAG: hypothetical protein K8S62_08935 [Candidatus Sabulitectum sp.]|nr:hypothetical protein [Candidatus Sabulitectum sp.]
MNKEQLRKMKEQIEKRENAVELVLGEYCSQDGCPCGFRKFVFWAGKEQGPGWMDNIQNQLVDSARKLECFSKLEKYEKACWLEGAFYCKNCGTRWNYYSEEWRMLAFRKRLQIIDEDDPNKLFDEAIGDEIFATVGHEPSGKKALSLEQWVEFMLEA